MDTPTRRAPIQTQVSRRVRIILRSARGSLCTKQHMKVGLRQYLTVLVMSLNPILYLSTSDGWQKLLLALRVDLVVFHCLIVLFSGGPPLHVLYLSTSAFFVPHSAASSHASQPCRNVSLPSSTRHLRLIKCLPSAQIRRLRRPCDPHQSRADCAKQHLLRVSPAPPQDRTSHQLASPHSQPFKTSNMASQVRCFRQHHLRVAHFIERPPWTALFRDQGLPLTTAALQHLSCNYKAGQ